MKEGEDVSNHTAVLFQALPPLAPDEYQALEQSIREHGIQVPIVVDENGVVIDGHHRQQIAAHLGIDCPQIVKSGYTDSEKRTLALSLNIDRRQLNREQKRALIAESLKADPQLSNREHGKRTGAHKNTVEDVRRALEDGGQIAHHEERVGADGVSQPASKPRPEPEPEPDIDDRFISQDELDELNAPAPPAVDSTAPKRRPITDAFFDAAYDLSKITERIERLAADDRFGKNSGQIAQKNLSDLTRSRDALQRVINQLSQA